MTCFGMIMYVGIVFGVCYLMFGPLFYKSRKAISIHLLQMCVIILLIIITYIEVIIVMLSLICLKPGAWH